MPWFNAKQEKNDTKDSTATFVHNRTRENIKSGEKHSTIFGKIARYLQDLKLVAFTGSYDDLSGKPQTMTPSAHTHTKNQISDFPSTMTPSAHKHGKSDITDFPSAMPPTAHKHTKSDITDFPQSMPASDVYAWAKASNKPSYKWSEIGDKPQTFPPSSHSHTWDSLEDKPDTLELGQIISKTVRTVHYGNPAGYDHKCQTIIKSTGEAIILANKYMPRVGDTVIKDVVRINTNSSAMQMHIGIMPSVDNTPCLGTSDLRWKQIFAVSSTISTSDKREKYNISYIGSESSYDTCMTDEMLVKFIMGLAPVVFKRTNGDSGRPHHGILSQDFEKLMQEIGLADHAAFIKSPVTKRVEKEIKDEDGNKRMELAEEVIPGEYRYGMRYEELITDTIRFCQILYNHNKELEERVKILEERK